MIVKLTYLFIFTVFLVPQKAHCSRTESNNTVIELNVEKDFKKGPNPILKKRKSKMMGSGALAGIGYVLAGLGLLGILLGVYYYIEDPWQDTEMKLAFIIGGILLAAGIALIIVGMMNG